MTSLFDCLGETLTPKSDWLPQAPPSLDGIHDIYLNFITTGLRWWEQDRPVAVTIGYGDKIQFCPWGMRGGGNLPEDVMKRWFKEQVKGKRITNANTRFEVHMAREWGTDLEEQGNEVSDVQHYAALLDDHRHRSALDILARDFLGGVEVPRLDETNHAQYHSSEVLAREIYTIQITKKLKEIMWPMLDEQGLQEVRALEDRAIYATCEMEKNGAPIDVELLDKWIKRSAIELNQLLWQLAKEVGFQCNPDSPKDMQRVFEKYKIPIEYTKKGAPSFADPILKRIDHPVIKLGRKIGKLASLRSKFLLNTKKNLDSHNVLRFALHQLRATKDETADSGEAGAVTGRYSSSEIIRGFGVNIQQRQKPAKQRASWGINEKDTSHDDEIFLLRKLHIASPGYQVLSSDMDQAQYRIFVHYVNNAKIIQAYKENPDLSFHTYMHELLRDYVDLTLGKQKDVNFAYIFGAGVNKTALMINHVTLAEFQWIKDHKKYNDPRLDKTKEVRRIYEREVEGVQKLLAEAAHLARPQSCCDNWCKRQDKLNLHKRLPHRGYVKTYKGRRSRFPDGQRLHKAFNAVDQGTEADYMKQKLYELNSVKKEFGFILRITNHDEVVMDCPDKECEQKVDTLLNTQSFNLRVPLTWSTGVGPNWAEC